MYTVMYNIYFNKYRKMDYLADISYLRTILNY